ncbi:MAG: hypothetical protein ACOC5T_03885 [Elusimicrobiota bacterium]
MEKEELSEKSKEKKEWLSAMGRGEIDPKDYPIKKPTKEDIISK